MMENGSQKPFSYSQKILDIRSFKPSLNTLFKPDTRLTGLNVKC